MGEKQLLKSLPGGSTRFTDLTRNTCAVIDLEPSVVLRPFNDGPKAEGKDCRETSICRSCSLLIRLDPQLHTLRTCQ